MSFVFICHVILVAPLSIASGGVGFADYLRLLLDGHDAAAAPPGGRRACAPP